jgi:hypothetical protein
MAVRFIALLGLLFGLATAAEAQQQPVSAADRAAIRDVIQGQVEAFRRDDGDAAFAYASPTIPGDGRPVTAVYPMTQLPDGSWRINGCYLLAPDEHQA